MAIIIAKKPVRFKGPSHNISSFHIQLWQILDAGKIMFDGNTIRKLGIDAYLKNVNENLQPMEQRAM